MPDTYEVILTKKAQDEIDQVYDWWSANRSPEQAHRWYIGFIEAMLTLEHSPHRCQLAPENNLFDVEIRHLTYGLGPKPTHRAIFYLRDDTVLILRVRHLSQAPIEPPNG